MSQVAHCSVLRLELILVSSPKSGVSSHGLHALAIHLKVKFARHAGDRIIRDILPNILEHHTLLQHRRVYVIELVPVSHLLSAHVDLQEAVRHLGGILVLHVVDLVEHLLFALYYGVAFLTFNHRERLLSGTRLLLGDQSVDLRWYRLVIENMFLALFA